MTQIIGIIGASGDLGSQLATRIKEHGFTVLTYSRTDPDDVLKRLTKQSEIIHVCAPVEAVKNMPPTAATIVLHDSVMHTSLAASRRYLSGEAAITHMLMNADTITIVANDAPHHDKITKHLQRIGISPRSMTIQQHDYMMARSQAPLALLCKTLLPYIYEQADKGLLTPSGQLLAETLRSRELAWTDATIHSILQNPELYTLINNMRSVINENQGETE